MRIPYELILGWRYTRRGRAAQRNGFISFIAGVSTLGITLGVAALIIVLSVMNGFQKEVRDRMLGVLSHIEVFEPGGNAIPDVEQIIAAIEGHPDVMGAAPFATVQALLARDQSMKGVVVRGIDPAREPKVSDVASGLASTALLQLQPGEFGIVLGGELARSLDAGPGDKISLITPGGQGRFDGKAPRIRQMTVVGTFESGHFQYDSALALAHQDDVMRVLDIGGPTGVRVKIRDLHAAREVAIALKRLLPPGLLVLDWTRQNRNWFAAVQQQKRIMLIILTLIVAVAAFNLISMLTMTVTDKHADIAILRTLGARPGSIMGIFMVQGSMIGLIGTGLGVLLGLGVAFNIGALVSSLERALGTSFLSRDIYFISRLPSDPQQGDIVLIALISLALSFVVTIYPSWRASRVKPAEALRYE